jgi:hypothetical protein
LKCAGSINWEWITHALGGKLRINAFYGFFPKYSKRHHHGASTKLSFRHLRHGATFYIKMVLLE